MWGGVIILVKGEEKIKKAIMTFLLSIGLMLGGISVVHAEGTLQSKIDATEKGGTLTLDVDYNEEVTINKDMTIDFQGHKLTSTTYGIVVTDGAKVTITGNGSVESEKGAVVNKNGTVVIENGNFNSKSWYTIKNLSNMTINGGTYTQGENKSNASLIANGWYDGAGSNGNDLGVVPPASDGKASAILTINGGNFMHKTKTSAIKSDDWSKTIIKNGNFESENGFLVQATGNVSISGGKFKGFNAVAVINGFNKAEMYPGILVISGGTFDAAYLYRPDDKGSVTVSGGTFNLTQGLIQKESKEVALNLIGGTYSVDVTDYVTKENLIVNKTDKGYTVEVNKTVVATDEDGEVIAEFETDSNAGISKDHNLVVKEEALKEEEKVTASLEEKLTESLKNDSKVLVDTKILKTYDITVTDHENQVVDMKDGKYTISLKVSSELTNAYKDFKVAYINDNGEVAELLDAQLKDGKIVFATTHLSTYAIIGYNALAVAEDDTPTVGDNTGDNVPNVPQTFDSSYIYAGISLVSLIAIGGSALYLRRRHN